MSTFFPILKSFLAIGLALGFAATPVAAQQLSRRQFRHDGYAVSNGMVKVLWLDADSTLRVSLSGSVSANSPTDVLILPGVPEGLARYAREGYLIAVASNQAGVSSPHVNLPIETADSALLYMATQIESRNPEAKIHWIDFAEGNDEFRKPGPGMALLLEAELAKRGQRIDWASSLMIGDSAYKPGDARPDGLEARHFSNSDRLFAERLGIGFLEPNVAFGWELPANVAFEKAEQVREYERILARRLVCSPIFGN